MLARAVTFTVLGQAGSLAVGFVTSILVARWLGPADRGTLALMASSANFALAFAAIGLPLAVMYYGSRPGVSHGALLGNTLLFAAVIGVVLVPLAWIFHRPIADVLAKGHGGALWAVAAALVPLSLLEYTLPNQLLAKLQFGVVNVATVAAKVVALALAIVLLGFAGLRLVGGLAVTAAVPVALGGTALWLLLRTERPQLDGALMRQLVRYGRRVQMGTVFQLANYRLDVIVAQFFLPLAAVGAYTMAEILAELVILLAQGFQTAVLPLVGREAEHDGEDIAALSLRHHSLLAFVATLGNAIFGALVIRYLLGPAYHSALVPFFILLPGVWFLGTGAVIGGNLRAHGRPGTASVLTGATVVVTAVLDVTLIPAFGIRGAAVASDIAYAFYGIASLAVVGRESRTSLLSLVLPTRADLALYRNALTRMRVRFS